MIRRLALALGILVAFFAGSFLNPSASSWVRPQTIAAQNDCQTFPETGKQVCGIFLSYWKANGGLAQQGYPISDVFKEQSSNGQTYDTQYFERSVFERHPENAGTRFEVLLSLLGSEKFKNKYPSGNTSGVGRVGERITRGTTALTVVAVTKATQLPGTIAGRTCQARAGYVLLTIEIVEENIGPDEHSYNRFNYGLKDRDGVKYDDPNAVECYPESFITSGDLAPGERIRGFLRYEVKDTAGGFVLEYSLFGGDESRIRITLE